MKKNIFITVLLVLMLSLFGLASATKSTSGSASQKDNDAVKVYGPGGPLGPMKELAEQFTKETGIKVEVTAGPEEKWIGQAKKDADIIYGGSEYMLTNFTLNHPGMIDKKTRTELYPRAAGILVRKGNPKNIQSLEDLTKKGVKIIDVNGAGQLGLWEDLAGRKGLIPGIERNIALSVKSSAEAIELWKANSKYDAWITYESWHYRLKDVTELVQLPEEDKLYRGTPISMTSKSDSKKEARKFIQYLKTEKSHQVFQKWGWK
ncbi:extracellular solute-binding protein [Bacillus aerolatus]|uniref:Extracellular solute-binding protein n=1 Tax=Bacillus aerolatus TaxID=2653354 RepID=A0A6I1FLL9_9BACI|nr:extracellular solute-binding protein [Bacillus aerolatus]KAB7707869.1 extracellular solute-binding protein [Bacillus aerolatus]